MSERRGFQQGLGPRREWRAMDDKVRGRDLARGDVASKIRQPVHAAVDRLEDKLRTAAFNGARPDLTAFEAQVLYHHLVASGSLRRAQPPIPPQPPQPPAPPTAPTPPRPPTPPALLSIRIGPARLSLTRYGDGRFVVHWRKRRGGYRYRRTFADEPTATTFYARIELRLTNTLTGS